MTTKADQVIDRAADSLRRFADRAATEGGVVAMFAEPLAEDAAFIRKLKPSLIIARAKGEAPTNQPAGSGAPAARGTTARRQGRSRRVTAPTRY